MLKSGEKNTKNNYDILVSLFVIIGKKLLTGYVKIFIIKLDKMLQIVYNIGKGVVMLKLYLDNCCYNRPFDDLKQEKICLEATAVEDILKLAIDKKLLIYKSIAIDFELSRISNGNKKRQVEDLYDAMNLIDIPYNDTIKRRAIALKKYNIKYMDALHIAFAENANVDYMITTDKLLLNASKRADLTTKVINPVEFIMEVI